MITLTAFRWVPPFAQGLVRDLRPRWALEECGIPYSVRLIGPNDQASEDYRKLQPFGQVPVIRDGDLDFFESGAMALHIAEKSSVLLPQDEVGRARARTWVFAALNSVEPHVQNLTTIDLFNSDKAWAIERRPEAVKILKDRLEKLDAWMMNKMYLEGDAFTVGDLVMTSVLRMLRTTDILTKDFPRLEAYRLRCEARPAFQRALDAQLKTFAENAPAAV